jgi:hypothetical protein
VLPGDTKVMGARLEAATDHMGAGSVMHSWATYSGQLTGGEIAGIFGSLPEIVVPTETSIGIVSSGGSIVITYEGGALQRSDTVDGSYADVAGASSPHEAPASGNAGFFRVN